MAGTTAFPTGTILGYPRIGRRRELKKAVEAFWAGRLSLADLEATTKELRQVTRQRLASLGLGRTDSSIPEAFSYYDQVLDAAVTVGAVPTRFERVVKEGKVDLPGYFTIARGEGQDTPAEMTKWFDSNYHYLVPEIGPETDLHLASRRLVEQFARGEGRRLRDPAGHRRPRHVPAARQAERERARWVPAARPPRRPGAGLHRTARRTARGGRRMGAAG